MLGKMNLKGRKIEGGSGPPPTTESPPEIGLTRMCKEKFLAPTSEDILLISETSTLRQNLTFSSTFGDNLSKTEPRESEDRKSYKGQTSASIQYLNFHNSDNSDHI